MPEFDVNYWAVLVATLAHFVLGAAWYGLLAKQWLAATGQTKEQVQEREKETRWVYLAQFVATLLLLTVAAYWIVNVAKADNVKDALCAGLLLALIGILACSGDFLYEGRSGKLFAINSGYRLVGMLVAAAIIGAWQ